MFSGGRANLFLCLNPHEFDENGVLLPPSLQYFWNEPHFPISRPLLVWATATCPEPMATALSLPMHWTQRALSPTQVSSPVLPSQDGNPLVLLARHAPPSLPPLSPLHVESESGVAPVPQLPVAS